MRREPRRSTGQTPSPWARLSGSAARSCSSPGLFAIYFTLRSVAPDLWAGRDLAAERSVLDGQHDHPRGVLVHLPVRRLRGRADAAQVHRAGSPANGAWSSGSSSPTPSARSSSAGQILEYATLVSEGVTLSSNAYGSAFYFTTGFHGLHVTGGLIAFLLVIGRVIRRQGVRPQGGDQRDRRLLLLALRRRRLDRPLLRHLHTEIATGRLHTNAQDTITLRARRAAKQGRRSPLATLALIAIGLLFTGGAYAAVLDEHRKR